MPRRTILALDFDGTIVEHKFPDIGALKPNVVGVINQLFNEGYYIIIWTCRSGFECSSTGEEPLSSLGSPLAQPSSNCRPQHA